MDYTQIVANTFTPSMASGSGFGLANITITIVVGLTLIFFMWAYLKWNREKGNPYFMYELTRQHPRFIEIEYYKKSGKGFRLDSRERVPYGEKGVYFRKLNKLLHVPESLIIDGHKMRKLMFLVTDTGVGAPLLMTDQENPELPFTFDDIKNGTYNEDKLREFIYNYDKWMKVAKANDDAYDLLLSQHIDGLYSEIQKKADDDKTWQERMMEAAPQFLLLGIVALSFLLNMYFVNDTIVQTNAQNVGVVSSVQEFYNSHLEQQVYCSLMISRYGSQTDMDKWQEMLNKDKPPNQ